MRAIATLKKDINGVLRVMVHEPFDDNGVYLYLFDDLEDGPAKYDLWFETMEEALECARVDYGVEEPNWNTIPDPLPQCQHDWIDPIRIIRDARNRPVEPFTYVRLTGDEV